jgi:hypothetical protein
MQPKFEKKLKSLLSILDTKEWLQKTISRYFPFKRTYVRRTFYLLIIQVIGDKVPHGLNLSAGGGSPHPHAATLPHPHHLSRRDSTASSESPSEPTKPVLRKHGKLITFFRSFILSRPTRGKLKKRGILKERVFGCDLGEHLLNTGQEGETDRQIDDRWTERERRLTDVRVYSQVIKLDKQTINRGQ